MLYLRSFISQFITPTLPSPFQGEDSVGKTALKIIFLALCVLAPAAAHAQTDTQTRLERLERDIETLSRSVFKGENPRALLSASSNADRAREDQINQRLGQMEQDLQMLTARQEEQGNSIAQLQRSLNDMITRLTALENARGTAQTSSPSIPMIASSASLDAGTLPLQPNGTAPANSPTVQPLGTLGTNPPAPGDPTFMYENALELLKQRDYVLAEKSLNDFMAAFPTHTLTPNAKYWLGETYFVQDRFDMAARVFAEGYQKYPKGPKAADNLLKLGLSLAALGKTTDACVALKQIAKDFPNGAAVVKSRADGEIKKLKCE